jgi:6-phosphogluconolactonase
MKTYVFVTLKDDNKITIFHMDPDTGKLSVMSEVPVAGGPSLLALSTDRKTLYVGHIGVPELSSWRINNETGWLTQNGSVIPEDPPSFLSMDRRGRFLLSSYYQGGHVAVHPISEDGSVGGSPIEWVATDTGAHAIQTDPSNKFAFVPHVARLKDNVMEPFNDVIGPNVILQFRFDENTGNLSPNASFRVGSTERLGPRHYCFHPYQDIVYFSNEQGSSVTAYKLDTNKGTLSEFQTITTLPGDFTGRNTCSQIQISLSGTFLYVPNRGHNSIASFSVDPATGQLTALGQVATEAVPSSFSLDPKCNFLFVAGAASGRLASYRVNDESGELTPIESIFVGNRPMWVLVSGLGV